MKGHAIPVKSMDNKNKFQEMLGDILEVARVQGNQLGMNEIKALFGDMNLDESQYEHIFAYLAANHIAIKGYVAGESEYTKALQKEQEQEQEKEEEVLDQPERQDNSKKTGRTDNHAEDSAYLKMYLEDIKGIKQSTPEEEKILLDKIIKGDDIAKNRYIEGNLHFVVKIAEEFKNRGISMEDLIQEGNIGLISSLEAISSIGEAGQAKATVADFVRRFMEAAISEQNDSSSFEKSIIGKLNYIRDAADELAEDLGREADIHELAGYINMTEEEIADVINMSVEGVKLDHKHGSKGNRPEDGHSGAGHGHGSHSH